MPVQTVTPPVRHRLPDSVTDTDVKDLAESVAAAPDSDTWFGLGLTFGKEKEAHNFSAQIRRVLGENHKVHARSRTWTDNGRVVVAFAKALPKKEKTESAKPKGK
jgi:hypothetical protein